MQTIDASPHLKQTNEYISRITANREQNINRIKERSKENLQRNFDRNMAVLEQMYASQHLQAVVSRFPVLGTLIENGVIPQKVKSALISGITSSKHELAKKADIFQNAFEKAVYPYVAHSAPKDMGNTVTLKSPETISAELDIPLEKAANASGKLDILIGNTNRVFANIPRLPSRSFGGNNVYQVSSQEGTVVPMDIADITPSRSEICGDVQDAEILQVYADNLMTIPHFKRYFATYCAALFHTPTEAMEFLKSLYHKSLNVHFWTNQGTEYSDKDPIIDKMKAMYVEQHNR